MKPFSHKYYAVKAVTVIILVYFGTSLFVSLFEYIYPLGENQHLVEIYTQGLWQILFLFLPTIYFAKKSPIPTKTILRISRTPSAKIFLLAIAGVLVLQILSSSYLTIQEYLIPNSLLDYYKSMEKAIDELYTVILGGSGTLPLIRAMFIGAIIPAISEETLFRGFFQKSLENELPIIKAILYPSLIFAFIHFNPISFIPLLAIGLYLGFIAYATDNLLLPITIHFLNNAIAIIIMFIPALNEIEDKASNIDIITAAITFIVSLALFIGIVFLFLKSKIKNKPKI